jgi:hypothetical protein
MDENFNLGPMSAAMRGSTILVHVLILSLLGIKLALAPGPPWWAVALGLLISIGTWLFMRPKAIRIDGEFLCLEFNLRKLRFGIGDIQNCRRLSYRDLGPTVRIGIGGLFGNFGIFMSKNFGSLHGYFCNGDALVFVEVKKGRSLLLSLDRPDDFVAALLKAKQSPAESGTR